MVKEPEEELVTTPITNGERAHTKVMTTVDQVLLRVDVNKLESYRLQWERPRKEDCAWKTVHGLSQRLVG